MGERLRSRSLRAAKSRPSRSLQRPPSLFLRCPGRLSFPLRDGLDERRLPIAQQSSHRVGLLLLLVLAEDVDIFRQHLADIFFVFAMVNRDDLDLGAFGQTAPER